MQPVIPPEMLSSAAQMMVYFVTLVTVLMSLMMTARG
jgi:hypothetical protein